MTRNEYKKRAQERRAYALEYIAHGGKNAKAKITGSNQDKMKKTAMAYTSKHGVLAVAGAFNLPAVDACPGAGECSKDCYADQGRYKIKNVWGRRWVNWAALGRSTLDMTQALLGAIRVWYHSESLPHRSVYLLRIHDSGDFFNQRYVDAWEQALKTFQPEMSDNHTLIAYGYTKSLHLDFSRLFTVPGVRFVQSLGGRYDDRVDWNFGVSAIVPKGSEIKGQWLDANGDPSIQDLAVIDGPQNVRIALTYHGPARMRVQWKTTDQLDRISTQLKVING
tara:strand:- start:215 stop:1051 length:837 start_codon:yes stop_codon:yes gene_type:complete